MPEWWFVLVGPVDQRDTAQAERLGRLPNVLRLGERSLDALPGYVQAYDVGTMWYPLNPVTEAAIPMKLYEYLAAGRACVSTPLPACEAAGGVWTAGDVAGFVAALEAARAAAGTEEFAAAAAAETAEAAWPKRLEPIFEALETAGLLRAPVGVDRMTLPHRIKRTLRPLIPDRVMARYRLQQHSLQVRTNVDVVLDPAWRRVGGWP